METDSSEQIRTQPAPKCLICGTAGEVLYPFLRDRSFGAPGEWNLRRCPLPPCGLIWLDPQPIPEDIGKAYATYYTHNQPAPGASLVRDSVYAVWNSYLRVRFGYRQGAGPEWRTVFAPLAMLHPGGLDELDSATMYLPAPHGAAKVLDVGCGSGVLFGDHAPTGKLAFSWPRSNDQLPLHQDVEGYDPLFPFGHGLSY
jgi:hypothetical protein